MLPGLRHARWAHARLAWRPTRSVAARARPRLPTDPDDLRKVPGIGARAAEVLSARDIGGIPALCRLFAESYHSEQAEFVEYLAVRSACNRPGPHSAALPATLCASQWRVSGAARACTPPLVCPL